MASAAHESSPASGITLVCSPLLRALLATALTAAAANCFLKYLWWTACYSAWNGIPKLAYQWRAAGVRASLNGWSFLALEAVTLALLFSLIRLRKVELPPLPKTALRVAASLAILAAGTTAFALVISWLKQDVH